MLSLNFHPFPILHTERLTLRQMTIKDAEDFYILRSDKDTMQYIPRPLAANVGEVRRLITVFKRSHQKNESINWAITLKDDNKMIGSIGFVRITPEHHRGEIGYILNPDFRGLGIMQEALHAVTKFGFEDLHFHKIEAIIDPQNISSKHVLEKANFKKEGHLIENYYFEGHFYDSVYYSLMNNDTTS